MLAQDLSRYRLARVISDEGLLRRPHNPTARLPAAEGKQWPTPLTLATRRTQSKDRRLRRKHQVESNQCESGARRS